MIIIGIDTETTGFSNADRIVQIGAAAFKGGHCIGKLSLLCDPGIPIPAPAQAVHGITDEMVTGCMTPTEAVTHLIQWIAIVGRGNDVSLVSHNAPFDRRFLMAAQPCLLWQQTHCTLKAARKALTALENHKLPTVAAACGVEIDNWHDACADAEAAARIAMHLSA